MKMKDALKAIKTIETAIFSPHYGATKRDRAVRISGCSQEQARELAQKVIRKIGGEYRYSPGLALVWIPWGGK